MLEINSILNIDCLEGMKKIDDKSIDLIFPDLPYGTTNCDWDSTIPLNDYVIIKNKILYEREYLLHCYQNKNKSFEYCRDWFNENKQVGLWSHYERIIKDSGVIALWAQSPFDKELVSSNKRLYRYEWIIEKTKATGHLNAKKMPMKAHESILIFYKKLPKYNPQMTEGHDPVHSYTKHTTDGNCYGNTKVGISGGGSTQRYPRDVLKFSWDTQKNNLHNCQKPVEACEYIIKTYTDEGYLILDNTAGSMTTAIAAINTGRKYICMEKDKEIFEIGKNRVDEHLKRKNGI